jgi:hypothetical protein
MNGFMEIWRYLLSHSHLLMTSFFQLKSCTINLYCEGFLCFFFVYLIYSRGVGYGCYVLLLLQIHHLDQCTKVLENWFRQRLCEIVCSCILGVAVLDFGDLLFSVFLHKVVSDVNVL